MSKRQNATIRLIIVGLVLIMVALALSAVAPKLLQPASNLHLGDGIFKTELALNDSQRIKGLSGRTALAQDEAMLFAFPTPGKWKIQIASMKIPIDIVWLDKDKKVVYIVKDASPDTAISDVFEPKSDAMYVVELPAGTVEKKSINIGRIAVFDLGNKEVK